MLPRLLALSLLVACLWIVPAHAVTFLANQLPDTLGVADSPFWFVGPAWTGNDTVVVEAGCDISISTSSGGILVSQLGALWLEGTAASHIRVGPVGGHSPTNLVVFAESGGSEGLV